MEFPEGHEVKILDDKAVTFARFSTWVELASLTVGYFFTTLFLIAAIFSWNTPGYFARSGALLVLSGVIVEYLQIKAHNKFLIAAFSRTAFYSGDYSGANQGTLRNRISIFAHIAVVLGTLIWGYGDVAISDWFNLID